MMSSFFQFISGIPVPFNMIILVVLIGAVAGVITTIAKQSRRYLCHREDLEFKRELVERGLSSQEIEQVIRARSPQSGLKD